MLVGDAIHLRVSGEQPHEGMTLEVRPVVYLMQPDYWQMALVACVPEGTPLSGPATQFVSEINVSGWVGRKGIDLSGGAKFKPLRIERPA